MGFVMGPIMAAHAGAVNKNVYDILWAVAGNNAILIPCS
jgi:5-keto 4-deoxyuronate isomerase